MGVKSAFNEHGSYLDQLNTDPAYNKARNLVDMAYQILLEAGYSNRDSTHLLTDEIFLVSVRDRALGRREGHQLSRSKRLARLRTEIGDL